MDIKSIQSWLGNKYKNSLLQDQYPNLLAITSDRVPMLKF